MADTEPNYYQILGIATGADVAEVKAAHKRLIRIWHPDKNPHRVQEATAQSSLINRARDVLSDPSLRVAYDQRHHVVLKRGANGTDRAPSPAHRAEDVEAERRREERARWQAQPDPDLAFTDAAFVQGHWYAHPEKGTFHVEDVTADRVHIRFRDGARAKFITRRLWAAWLGYLYAQGSTNGRGPAADPAMSAEGDRARQQRAAEEAARRTRERAERDEAERQQREAQDRVRQEAEAQARRAAEEYARRAAQEHARQEAEARLRQELERRAREQRASVTETEHARDDVIATAEQIARKSGGPGVARFLASVGWVTLVDRRAERGPLIAIPDERSRDQVDGLFTELKRWGLPLLRARGGAGVTDGRPAWIVR